jgi:uncharacterized protein involved in exopolysaccharide biosynthesis
MQVFDRVEGYYAGHTGAGPPGGHGPNRRLLSFLIVFVLVTALGLGYTFLRTPQYRATARLEIVPAEGLQARNAQVGVPQPASSQNERGTNAAASPFLTEIEFLTSRPLLEQLLERIRATGLTTALAGSDPIAALLQAISVTPVAGTQVVQLAAVGEKSDVLAFALNGLMEIYRDHVAARYRDTSDEALAQAKEEAQRYDAAVREKRRAMEAFRTRHDIVSLERDENEALARVKGLATSLNAAEEKAVASGARLRSLRDAVASGKAAVRARDNPTLANLEARLSQAREELRQLERSYTEDYLAKDPAARTLRVRIAEFEAQIKRERVASQETNLAEAEEEAVRTRDNVQELRSRLAADRRSVQAFSARFGEYKAMQEELTNLEGLLRGANEKAVRLEASDRARRPEAKIIEAAITPVDAWRPLYLRDSAITVVAAIALGFLAAWLTAFLTRREAGPSVVVTPTTVAYPLQSIGLQHASPQMGSPALMHAEAQTLQLPAAQPVLRELDEHEVAALLASVDEKSRFVLALLLSGIAPDEVPTLTWSDVQLDAKTVRVKSPVARELPLAAELSAIAAAALAGQPPQNYLLTAHGRETPAGDDLDTLVAYACHDAGLSQPSEITPAALRHTYLAFMARQGVRFGELARIVGPLSAQVIAAYGVLAPEGAKRSMAEVQSVHPGLQKWAGQGDNADGHARG